MFAIDPESEILELKLHLAPVARVVIIEQVPERLENIDLRALGLDTRA